MSLIPFLLCVAATIGLSSTELPEETEEPNLRPTVLIAMLVRNKAHVLPFTLPLLENLDYPKNRISLWIRSDHNEDDTDEILTIWTKKWQDRMNQPGATDVYHSLDVEISSGGEKSSARHPDEDKGPFHWSKTRFQHVMKLREDGLQAARKAWADWVGTMISSMNVCSICVCHNAMLQPLLVVTPTSSTHHQALTLSVLDKHR